MQERRSVIIGFKYDSDSSIIRRPLWEYAAFAFESRYTLESVYIKKGMIRLLMIALQVICLKQTGPQIPAE